jgi:hypothetical protein
MRSIAMTSSHLRRRCAGATARSALSGRAFRLLVEQIDDGHLAIRSPNVSASQIALSPRIVMLGLVVAPLQSRAVYTPRPR